MRAYYGAELDKADERLVGQCLDCGAYVRVEDEGERWLCMVVKNEGAKIRVLPTRLVRGAIPTTTTEDERASWQRMAFSDLGKRLVEIRQRIVESGEPLLGIDEINESLGRQ